MTEENKKTTSALLKRLSTAIGVTGYSGPDSIQAVLAAEMTPYVERVEEDRLGSVIGVKPGEQTADKRRKVMIAAHLDEIGAVVTSIDRGVLRFTQVGGLDERVLMGQEVVVHGRQALPGLIGSTPPHLLTAEERDRPVEMEKLHVDVGLPPDRLAELVRVGDLISFARPPADLLNHMFSGKALDNRVSVAAMLICLQTLQQLRHQWDVYAVATADEEWGRFVGATTQSYAIRPDLALVTDVTFADVDETDIKLDGGPALGLGPSNHPALRKRLLEICQKWELKHQDEITPHGAGTDAYAIEISREGVPTILLSLPSRYMHSPVEVVHLKDVERLGRLMAYFIASLEESFIEELIPGHSE